MYHSYKEHEKGHRKGIFSPLCINKKEEIPYNYNIDKQKLFHIPGSMIPTPNYLGENP